MTKHNAICISALHQIFNVDENLNAQQKDIVIMYAFGHSIEEISDIKGISPHTVRKYLDNIRVELGGITLSGVKAMIHFRTSALMVTMLTKLIEKGNL